MLEDYKLVDGHYIDKYSNWIPKRCLTNEYNEIL